MSKSITKQDLKDDYGPGPDPFLYCDVCGASYSAHKSDYFWKRGNEVFRCCEEPMRLMRKVVRLEEV